MLNLVKQNQFSTGFKAAIQNWKNAIEIVHLEVGS